MGYRPRRPLGPLPPLGSQSSAAVSPEQSSFTIASQLASQGAENAIGPDEQGVAIASPLNSSPGAMRGGTASSSTIRFSQANSDPSVGPPVMTLNSRGGKAGGSYSPKQTLSSGSAGMPLAPSVRSPLARSFGADLSPIRVHTDANARNAAMGLSAKAFTVANQIYLGSGQRPDDLGLIAHETAHVLQQRGAPAAMQPFTSSGGDAYEAEAQQASAAVVRGESFTVQQSTSTRPQRWELSLPDIDWPDPLDWLANKANVIPFFRLFTIVLGVNPINMSPVDRNAANLLRAMIEIMPGGGLITQALDNSGVFEKAGAFVETQIASLGMTGSAIKSAVTAFIDGLSLRRLVTDPGGVWESAKAIFTGPIDQIIAFGAGLVSGIVELVKDAILKPIAKMAEGTEGYNLLKGILGKDPITGEAVTPSAETLLGPLMKMIGLGDVWQKMQDAKAIPRAWAWFQSTMGQLLAIVSSIPSAFIDTFKSLTLEDIILVPKAFIKLGKVFLGFMGKFVSWGLNAMWKLLEIVFDVVSPGAWGYAQKTGAALKSILKNPLPFVGNLAKAAKLGFQNFGGRFLTHLKNGLIDWLTGSLTGIYIPKALTLIEFGKMAISVLGLSWIQIRGKIVKALGPHGELIMQGLEAAFDVIKALVTGGPQAAWEVLKDKLTGLKDTIVSGITSMVIEAVVTKAIPKFIAMFIPGAGFVSAIISIYDIVMVFVEKISKIIQVVNAFVSSIVAIAAGNIGAAAGKVESILAGLLALAINFLAGFAGLGKIASKVRGIVEKVRDTVDKALDAAIAFIIAKAKALFASLFGKGKDGKPVDPEKQKKIDAGIKTLHDHEKSRLKGGKLSFVDAKQVAGLTKSKHSVFKTMEAFEAGNFIKYRYTASPAIVINGPEELPKHDVNESAIEAPETTPGATSWDWNIFANITDTAGARKVTWVMIAVPMDADLKIPKQPPAPNMLIEGRVTIDGEKKQLRLNGGSITEYALKMIISRYQAKFGDLNEIHGSLAADNKSLYQMAYANLRNKGVDEDDAKMQAILKTPFGKYRAKLGYDKFTIDIKNFTWAIIPKLDDDPKKRFFVPQKIDVIAKR